MPDVNPNIKESKDSYRQIFKATSIFGGVQVFNIIIAIIRTKVIAVLLGPTGIGIAGLLTSTTGLISSLTNLGLETSAVKDVSEAYVSGDRKKTAQIVSIFRKLVWVTGLIGLLITIIFSPWLSELTFGHRNYTWAFVWLSVTLLINQLSAGQKVILQGMRQIKYLASANMLASVLSLFITLPLYYFYGLDGIVPALILMALASLAVSTYYSRKVKIVSYKPSIVEIKERGKGMLKLGFFLSLSGLTAALGAYIVKIFINNVGGVDDVGLYSAGFQIITTYVGLVFTAMGTDYFPRLSAVAQDTVKSNELINQQAEVAILILLPIILIFMVFVPEIVIILYSTKFLPINDMIIWAAFAMFFKAAGWAIAFQFLAKGSSRLFFVNELSANVYMLGFNILGYYWYGLTGLGYSFLLTYLIYFAQVWYITHRYYGFAIKSMFLKSLVFAVVIGGLCLMITIQINDFYKYAIGVTIILIGSVSSLWQLNKRIKFLK